MKKKQVTANNSYIDQVVQQAREDRKHGLYDVYTREDHQRFLKKMLNKYAKKNN